MIPKDEAIRYLFNIAAIGLILFVLLSMSGCSSKPYAEFKEVPKGKYVIMLEVKDETTYGNNYDGAADSINGIWALQAKPDFCLVVHEIAHVLYKDYHGRYYNECISNN